MLRKKGSPTETPDQPLALRPAPEERAFNPFGPAPKTDSPRTTSHRWPWVLGVLLLIFTMVGAALVLNQSFITGSNDGNVSPADAPPPGIVALGFVAADPDVVNLYPMQPGRVIYVIPEGKEVAKEGETLLCLDDRLAILVQKEAETALEDARDVWEKAKIALKKHDGDVELQKRAVAIALSKCKIAQKELDIKEHLFKDDAIKKNALEIARETFNGIQEMLKLEKDKERLLDIQKAVLLIEIKRGGRDFQAKKILLDKARLAVDECKILSRGPGTVLRVFVHPQEVLPGNAKIPAIQFRPRGKTIVRAEVLQEWAGQVKPGQKVAIEDDTRAGNRWTGSVRQVSDWFTQKRNVVLEPFMVNDVRTLECVIDVHPGGSPMRIGQRVRVIIEP